jgi:hypothetical protein
MMQMERRQSFEELEAKLEELEAKMSTQNIEQLEINDEVERSASFFTPIFAAILLTIAIFIINKFVVS